MAILIERVILPLVLILLVWLIFEIIEFFRLGGASQPLAWCIVKISVITSTIIGLSHGINEEDSVNYELILEKVKSLSLINNE